MIDEVQSRQFTKLPAYKFEDNHTLDFIELNERCVRKIESLKQQISEASSEPVYNLNQLLLKDAEHFQKLTLQRAIESVSNSVQKELIVDSLLENSQNDHQKTPSNCESSRNDWILNSVHRRLQLNATIEDIPSKDSPNYLSTQTLSQSPPLLFGSLFKISRKIVVNTSSEVWCELYSDKLQIFKIAKNQQKLLSYSIPFSLFKMTVEFSQPSGIPQLIIKVFLSEICIQLRDCPSSNLSVEMLYKAITQSQQAFAGKAKHRMEERIIMRLMRQDYISEAEFNNIAESGDILLFETQSLAASLQRGATSSKYDHVGMVIKLTDGITRVFDAVGNGVSLTEWNRFVYENGQYNACVFRKLTYKQRERNLSKLYEFVEQSLGAKYSLTFLKLTKKTSNIQEESAGKSEKSFFCSELIAKAFKEIGIITSLAASSSYWPRSFSSQYDGKEIKLLDQASLGEERMIILDAEITGKCY